MFPTANTRKGRRQATRPVVDTLRQRRTQPHQQVVLLSDGGDTLRRLQQNIAPEATMCWIGSMSRCG